MKWTKQQFSIMAIVSVTSFMSTFLISSVSIALPAIEYSFHLDAVKLSWVVTAFLLATAMFLLPIGKWGDLKGIRLFFKLGVTLFTLSSIACGFSPSGFWLIFFRFIQGIGAAFTSTTGPAILVSAFLPKFRGRVIGIAVSSVYSGLAFGPFMGGILTELLGWRYIFFAASLLGVIMMLMTFGFLGKDEARPTGNSKLDMKGTLLYMLGLTSLVYGSTILPSKLGLILLASGTSALILFWIIESKSKLPVIETKLYTQNRLFAFSNLAALINYSATFAIIFLLSLYLQKIQHLMPREAGTILIAQPITMAIFSPLAGRLSDKIQTRYISSLGMFMCTIGLAAFALLSISTPIWVVVCLLIWVGLGFALFSSPNMSTIMGSVNKSQLGLASGSAATMRVIGQITSMTIATFFFAILFGKKAVTAVSDDLFISALRWGFISFSIISVVGIYFSYNRGNTE